MQWAGVVSEYRELLERAKLRSGSIQARRDGKWQQLLPLIALLDKNAAAFNTLKRLRDARMQAEASDAAEESRAMDLGENSRGAATATDALHNESSTAMEIDPDSRVVVDDTGHKFLIAAELMEEKDDATASKSPPAAAKSPGPALSRVEMGLSTAESTPNAAREINLILRAAEMMEEKDSPGATTAPEPHGDMPPSIIHDEFETPEDAPMPTSFEEADERIRQLREDAVKSACAKVGIETEKLGWKGNWLGNLPCHSQITSQNGTVMLNQF